MLINRITVALALLATSIALDPQNAVSDDVDIIQQSAMSTTTIQSPFNNKPGGPLPILPRPGETRTTPNFMSLKVPLTPHPVANGMIARADKEKSTSTGTHKGLDDIVTDSVSTVPLQPTSTQTNSEEIKDKDQTILQAFEKSNISHQGSAVLPPSSRIIDLPHSRQLT